MKVVVVLVIVTAASAIWVLGWYMDFLEARENTIPMDPARRRQFVRLDRQSWQNSYDPSHHFQG